MPDGQALVVTVIEKVKRLVPEVHVEEIDVAANPGAAVNYGVMSTPAIAINGKLAFTGVPREETLLARLESTARATQGGSA